MTSPQGAAGDAAILDEIRGLAASLSDERTQGILQSVIDAVALNPQPLPPRFHEIFQSFVDAVALNPQPLPPEPAPDAGPSA